MSDLSNERTCGDAVAAHQNRSAGFTLVEVSIIVMSLAILSAILLPQIGVFMRDARMVRAREDVAAIGVSILSGAHLPLLEKLATVLRQSGLEDKLWLAGGVIPAQDRDAVRRLGFAGVFPTGSSFDDIAAFIRERLQ